MSLALQKHLNTSLAMQIIFVREFLKEVRMKADQVKYLVTNARNGMCQGHRAELFAVKAAKACAALAVSLTVCSGLETEKRAGVMILGMNKRCIGCKASSSSLVPC